MKRSPNDPPKIERIAIDSYRSCVFLPRTRSDRTAIARPKVQRNTFFVCTLHQIARSLRTFGCVIDTAIAHGRHDHDKR